MTSKRGGQRQRQGGEAHPVKRASKKALKGVPVKAKSSVKKKVAAVKVSRKKKID